MLVEYDVTRNSDGMLEIASVGGDWNKVALESECEGLVAEKVEGTQLLRHVSSDVTRMWVEAAITSALVLGEVKKLTYRCDTPDKRRVFELSIIPADRTRATLKHALLQSEDMVHVVDIKPSKDPTGFVLRCSICNFVRLKRQWVDPFELGEDRAFDVVYSVCEPCRDKVRTLAATDPFSGPQPS